MSAKPETHPMHGENCSRRNCGKPAKYRLSIELHPPAVFQDAKPIEVHTLLRVCMQHRDTLTPADCIDDKGWQYLLGALRQQGVVLPDRARTRLRFYDLDSDPWGQHVVDVSADAGVMKAIVKMPQ